MMLDLACQVHMVVVFVTHAYRAHVAVEQVSKEPKSVLVADWKLAVEDLAPFVTVLSLTITIIK